MHRAPRVRSIRADRNLITANDCIGYTETCDRLGRIIDMQALHVIILVPTSEDYWDRRHCDLYKICHSHFDPDRGLMTLIQHLNQQDGGGKHYP